MAHGSNSLTTQTTLVLFALFFYILTIVPTNSKESYATTSPPDSPFLHKPSKLTHLSFYLHVLFGKPNATTIAVATAPGEALGTMAFGMVNVVDDIIRTGPEGDSKLIGYNQALSVEASKTEPTFLMAMNFFFTDGSFNGSTLSLLGRNNPSAPLRELPIIGGSGVFRFAYGYVLTSTYSSSSETGITIAKYDAYVYHY